MGETAVGGIKGSRWLSGSGRHAPATPVNGLQELLRPVDVIDIRQGSAAQRRLDMLSDGAGRAAQGAGC